MDETTSEIQPAQTLGTELTLSAEGTVTYPEGRPSEPLPSARVADEGDADEENDGDEDA